MESTESGSIEDTLDSKNLETAVEDIVTKYEDSETLSSQNEEDQSGEQVYGYLYRSAGSEDATIYVDSRGFNLNGQSLIVTQNDDGNEIIVLVGEDPDGPPLDQTFAHTVLETDEVSFEEGLKEHGTLVVDEHSQGLEFIKSSEEVPEDHEERHMYIENSGEIINISNENVGSPVGIESPLWSVSNSGHLKNDGTEMLFIPNPTVVLAPEETKHRKLMQLACIAHELQSADQKSSSAVICDYVKNPEPSVSEYAHTVKVTQSDEEKNFANEETNDKCLLPDKTEESRNFNSKSTKIVSSVLSEASMRVVDNTVSVIHSTSSEIQGCSLENQTKPSSPPDFSSEKNFPNSESDLPSEMLYSNISNVTFHQNLDGSSITKQLEECSRDGSEQNSRSSVAEVTNERCSAQTDNLELHNNVSPLTFTEKSHKLDVDSLNIEVNALGDADLDVKIDEDNHATSSVLIIEDENPKSHDSDSSLSLMECPLSRKMDIIEQTSLDDKVPNETGSELNASDIDDDNISSTEHSISISENESSFLSSKYSIFNYKEKAIKSSSEKNPILSPVLQDDKSHTNNDQPDLNESNIKELKVDETEINENVKGDTVDFEQSPTESLDSNLVIAETVEERETAVNEAECTKDDSIFSEDLKQKSVADVNDTQELVSPDTTCVSPDPKESNDDKVEPVNLNSSPARNAEEFSVGGGTSVKSTKKLYIRSSENNDEHPSNEDPLNNHYKVKDVRKTYILKKRMEETKLENKTNTREKIELFSGEDLNFNEYENDMEMNSPKEFASCIENNIEPDDHLVSDVQSKVNAERTYTAQKEKSHLKKKISMSPKKGLRSHSLRPRSLSSSLILKNGNHENFDRDSRKNCLDLNNSDNLAWGKVLLETSFHTRVSPNDVPSTSFASQYPKETSTPLLSPEQRRRKLNKYKRDFDRLLNSSSPIATKQPKIGKKYSSRMHSNVIKATKSRYSSSHFSRFPKSSSLPNSARFSKSSPARKVQGKLQKLKEAKIQYLYQGPTDAGLQPANSHPNKDEMYSCSSCNFSSIYVDNLIEHLKYCSNRQPVLDYEVNNMDKRQRIRGEEEEITNTVNNTLKKIRSDLRSALMDEDPSVNFAYQFGEEERDSDNTKKRKSLYRQYGYGDDDVVWVKFRDRFWPALVCSIEGMTAFVKLINYPKEVKGLKVKHENIRTFDNSKWNLLCLAEAGSLPHNEIFVKAVQSCERFMSKKFLGVQVTGKEFFSVRDEVDFATDSASSDSVINEDSDSELDIMFSEPARKSRYEKLDVQKIYDHIIGRKSDDYVLDIYHKRRHSKKHQTFFESDGSDLKHKPWFGPFEDPRQQEELFCYFRELFLKKIGKKGFFVSYICQVWIPEAIVQAISVVQDIPLKDAEMLFESEDSLDLENEDPSVEEILKKYS